LIPRPLNKPSQRLRTVVPSPYSIFMPAKVGVAGAQLAANDKPIDRRAELRLLHRAGDSQVAR